MKRIFSGVILAVVTIAVVGWAPRWVFFLALVVLSTLALGEFLDLAERCGLRPARTPAYLYGLWLLGEQLLFPQHFSAAAFTLFVMFLLCLSLRDAERFSSAMASAGSTLLGTMYIVGFLSLLLAWKEPQSDQAIFHVSPFQNRAAIFFVLVVIWAADIGAFYVGRTLGRHKMAPRISPGKTIEGFFGGLAASLLMAAVFQRYWLREYGFAEALVLAAILNVAGVMGDLVESALKRGAGVKDSSSLIPGHGGILDRIDSLLFAVPIMYYYPSLVVFLKSLAKIA
jgi:phosphatidate cytidylyltransferase